MSDVKGLRVIVTGGASGMGEAMVKDFSRHGAKIVSMDVNNDAGKAIAAAAGADFVPCDVSDEASVQAGFERAAGLLDGLDVLIHAAGVAPGAPAEAITLSGWEKVFAINARGTFLTNQTAFRYLKANGGRIINFASAAGVSGLPNKAHYSATKGAVISWTRTVAKEWGQYGITANCIAPAIETPMYLKTRSLMSPAALDALDAKLLADMPIDGKLGDPDRDLMPLMRFLSGAGSRFITGQIFAVDGGITMVR
jgi:NAD(P)-dependent dehydrogenase (short-subunit alcohol dehydrogenase family)